jgi:hypothetical protein
VVTHLINILCCTISYIRPYGHFWTGSACCAVGKHILTSSSIILVTHTHSRLPRLKRYMPNMATACGTSPPSSDTLSRFLEDMHERETLFKLSKREEHDVESAVVTMIWTILEEVAVMDERFKISKLIKAGSFYEGTRIRQF